MNYVACGYTQSHLITKPCVVELVTHAARVKRDVLDSFKIGSINRNLRRPSIIANEPILPTNLRKLKSNKYW